jgi:hypothetical protein
MRIAPLPEAFLRDRERMGIAGRSPGGRPLRRRRELVLISANRGYEGP